MKTLRDLSPEILILALWAAYTITVDILGRLS
jgi:hypothetical protein